MSNVSIVNSISFSHQFFLTFHNDGVNYLSYDEKQDGLDKVINWLIENISGRWVITEVTDCRSFSIARHDSPFEGLRFPPQEVNLENSIVVMFEEETDAAAFKLNYK